MYSQSPISKGPCREEQQLTGLYGASDYIGNIWHNGSTSKIFNIACVQPAHLLIGTGEISLLPLVLHSG